ncbi:fimbria/pilus outer membrane usher protein, partial [Escherichia coli]
FDSVQMTGIKLETDTSMLPDSEQGFAPVVRGIANSDAQVVIKQNGYVIYQTWVSA